MVAASVDKWMDGCLMDKWMGGGVDGWMGRQMAIWMGKWMGGQVDEGMGR